MNKKEFLTELKERLVGVSPEDRKEILQDYEEHFKAGKKKKRSEEEIAESLGNPKEIAKDIRRELSGKNGKEELKDEAIESWVVLKRFFKHLFQNISEKSQELYDRFDSKKPTHWAWLVLGIVIVSILLGWFGGKFLFILLLIAIIILLDNSSKSSKKPKHPSPKKTSKEKSIWKIILIILLSVFLFFWIWLGLFGAVLGLFIGALATILAGILLIIISIFYLISYSGELLNSIIFSTLFAGIGVTILGVLLTTAFNKLMILFFKLTKSYLKLNRRWMNK